MTIMTNVIFLVILVVPVVLLQIYLSRMEAKWPGLVLPILLFLYPVLMVLSYAVYVGIMAEEIVLMVITTFLLGGIPSYLLAAIYFICRRKYGKRNQLDKMNIQDLD